MANLSSKVTKLVFYAQVITPPEFANMQPFVTIDQLNALANTTIQVSLLHSAMRHERDMTCCMRVQAQHSYILLPARGASGSIACPCCSL